MGTTDRLLPGAPPPRPTAARWSLWPSRPAPWLLRGRRLPDGPVRWAIVQPNAVGRCELSTLTGLVQRQLLRAAYQHHGERLVIVAGERSVAIWPVVAGRFAGRCVGEWPADRLLAVPVEANVGGGATGVAVVLVDLDRGRLLAEVRGVRDDEHTRAVFAALRP